MIGVFEDMYINSGFDQNHRNLIIGIWTIDLKDFIAKLTDDLDNTEMYRKVIRGDDQTQRRRNDQGARLGKEGLQKRSITDVGDDWLGTRYAYEIWIVPKKRVAGLWAFNHKEVELLSACLQKIVRAYDNFLGKKCPYIMGIHSSADLEDKNFHFHVEFYPPLRHEDKPKILAGSESMAGVFIMDVLPEDSAKTLRKFF